MARVTSPICKRCRREGKKLFLKGERCYTSKCPFTRRSYAPGERGIVRTRLTEYGQQLREKQKAKAVYGILEKQFRNYYKESQKGREKKSMLELIERRLDNVIYRLGFASSRRQARQMVTHNHFLVNKKNNNIPSYKVKVGDKIEFKNKESKFIKNIKNNQKRIAPVSWLKYDPDKMIAEVTSLPKKEDVEKDIEERLIIEYYSR